MTHASPSRSTVAVPARGTAFVVHLTAAPADPACGRVEHVATGRAARFESPDELVRFMRDTLTAVAADGR